MTCYDTQRHPGFKHVGWGIWVADSWQEETNMGWTQLSTMAPCEVYDHARVGKDMGSPGHTRHTVVLGETLRQSVILKLFTLSWSSFSLVVLSVSVNAHVFISGCHPQDHSFQTLSVSVCSSQPYLCRTTEKYPVWLEFIWGHSTCWQLLMLFTFTILFDWWFCDIVTADIILAAVRIHSSHCGPLCLHYVAQNR